MIVSIPYPPPDDEDFSGPQRPFPEWLRHLFIVIVNFIK
jgi:hypothetical protein